MREALTIGMALLLLAIGAHMLARPAEYTKGRRRMRPWTVRPLGVGNIIAGFVILHLAHQLLTQG